MKFISKFRSLFRKGKLDAEMTEEMRLHVELQTELNRKAGMEPDEAHCAALRQFGNVAVIQEQAREARGWVWLEQLCQDVRYAARALRRKPGFTAVAGLTLALSIGASTAIFSVVNSVLLRPLPFADPGRLVQLWEGAPGTEIRASGLTVSKWSKTHTVLENLAAYTPTALNLAGGSVPERLRGLRVSADYLRVFRVDPVVGRGFRPEEDQPGSDKVVILTHGLWQRGFGGASDLVGRTIQLGGETRTVIGVLPAEPACLGGEYEFLIPLALGGDARAGNGGDRWLQVVARLQSGVSLAQARAALGASMEHRADANPPAKAGANVSVVPLDVQMTAGFRPKLWILFGAVGFLLLIACANVAGLLLARGMARQGEIAIRAALGAGRWRIVRQLLTESLLLSMFGGMLGALLAFWGTQALVHGIASNLPRAAEIGMDSRALLFALATSLTAGLCFGLVPALQTGRTDLRGVFARGAATRRTVAVFGLRDGLNVAQIAFALILLAGSGLMLKSLWQLTRISAGFETKNLLGMSVSLDSTRYPDPDHRLQFWNELARRLESLPGVESVGMAGGLPMNEWNNTTLFAGRRADSPGSDYSVDFEYVGGDYFRTLCIPLIRGRGFEAGDNARRAPRTAILSAALAQKAFPDGDAVGRQVTVFGKDWEVIGVAGEVRRHGIDQGAWDCVYLPQVFSGAGSRRVMVRTGIPPLTLGKVIRNEVLALDPNQPVSNLRTMEQVVQGSFADRRLMLMVLGSFAGAALLLAALGLYGVMAYSVSQRTREIGIRMALGAQRGDVLQQIMQQGLRLCLFGVALGLGGAFALTRVMAHLLFGVTAQDPFIFGVVALLLMAVALLACWWPARRAAQVDPLVALRAE